MRGGSGDGKSKPEPVLWVEQESAKVKLVLHNSLVAAVEVNKVELVTDPPHALLNYPFPFEIASSSRGNIRGYADMRRPPKNTQVNMHVVPLISGDIRIKAVRFQMSKLVFTLDATAEQVVRVVPKLPYLNIKNMNPQSKEMLTFIQGESMEGFVTVENTGTVAMHHLKVGFKTRNESRRQDQEKEILSTFGPPTNTSPRKQQSSRPQLNFPKLQERWADLESRSQGGMGILEPGDSIDLPICIRGYQGLNKVQMIVTYAGVDPALRRTLDVQYELNVVPSIRVSTVEWHTTSNYMYERFHKSLSDPTPGELVLECPHFAQVESNDDPAMDESRPENPTGCVKGSSPVEQKGVLLVHVENPTSRPFYLSPLQRSRTESRDDRDALHATTTTLLHGNTVNRIPIAVGLRLCDNQKCTECDEQLCLHWWLPQADSRGTLHIPLGEAVRNRQDGHAGSALKVWHEVSCNSGEGLITFDVNVRIENRTQEPIHGVHVSNELVDDVSGERVDVMDGCKVVVNGKLKGLVEQVNPHTTREFRFQVVTPARKGNHSDTRPPPLRSYFRVATSVAVLSNCESNEDWTECCCLTVSANEAL